jgi:hypothetical protein
LGRFLGSEFALFDAVFYPKPDTQKEGARAQNRARENPVIIGLPPEKGGNSGQNHCQDLKNSLHR